MSAFTLPGPVEHATEVKHSRFRARAVPAADPAAALAWLREAGDPDATHNCWAWRIGDDYRSSDDGEPAGTAGRPILAAIDGQGFDRIVVLVTRWFGGIKLGAGGLVRAYGGAAAECLRTAPRVPLVRSVDATLRFPFAETGAVHAVLQALEATRLDEAFSADGVRVRVRVPEPVLPDLKLRLIDATRDRVQFD